MMSSCVRFRRSNVSLGRLTQTLLQAGITMVISVWLIIQVTNAVRRRCSYSETVQVVEDICRSYRRGQLLGPMCSRLCVEDVFTYEACGQDASSDKFVLSMGCHGCNLGKYVSKVVMKGKFNAEQLQNISTSKPLDLIILQTQDVTHKHLVLHLGQDISEKRVMLSKLLGTDFKAWASDKPRHTVLTMLRTLVSLSTQSEYVKMAILGPTPYLPKLYGFCGPAYFVEYTPSLNQQGYIIPYKSDITPMRLSFASWSERAKAALSLLSVIQLLENTGTTPLNICDMEIRNTAIASNGNVVFLDIDKMRYGMASSGRNCTTDFCCRVETCKGRCDKASSVCLPGRINNNLQVVCKKLFVGHVNGMFGLLRFPPSSIKDELTKVLDQCVSPERYQSRSVFQTHAAGPEIRDKLKLLLLKSL